MKKRIYIITILGFCLFGFNQLKSQTSILDQYIFSSKTDSILLNEHLDSTKNYLISLYGDWCGDCTQQLEDYLPKYEHWQQVFDLEYIILDDFSYSDIESGLSNLSDYPYQSFITNRIRVDLNTFNFPVNFYIKEGQVITLTNEEFTPADKTESNMIAQFPKNGHSIFRGEILQEQIDYLTCSPIWNTLETGTDTVMFNGNSYWRTIVAEEVHYLRESEDANYVYYFDSTLNEEYVLFDYTSQICDAVSLYSPSEKRMIHTKVIDRFCSGTSIYIELNIPHSECHPYSTNYTLISGIGSTGGLLPIFDESSFHSTLSCHYIDEKLELQIPIFDPCDDILYGLGDPISAKINLYPNPTNGVLYFDMENFGEKKIEIINITGDNVFSQTTANNFINLTSLASGLYIFSMEHNGYNLRKKFFKN